MTKEERKQRPMFSGLRAYFPDALMEVAYVSYLGNEQHNPGQPLHWNRSKSADDIDAADRHMTDRARGDKFDDDGARHLAKAAWRILAALQKELEDDQEQPDKYCVSLPNGECVSDDPRCMHQPIYPGRIHYVPSRPIMGSDGKDYEW